MLNIKKAVMAILANKAVLLSLSLGAGTEANICEKNLLSAQRRLTLIKRGNRWFSEKEPKRSCELHIWGTSAEMENQNPGLGEPFAFLIHNFSEQW